MSRTRWALLGAAGYVAPRHMRAIRETGGELVAACDPHDSVGVLDEFAPGCMFFTDEDAFFRRLAEHPVDAVAICTPNDRHVPQALRAMKVAPLVLCEKPLALHPWDLGRLAEQERATGSTLGTVLQLRHHDAVRELPRPCHADRVEIEYITPRGPWYQASWKGDEARSGGIVVNIGAHLFDLCLHLFGSALETSDVSGVRVGREAASGRLVMERAPSVAWRLSTEASGAPRRVFRIDGTELDLSPGFTDLHMRVYESALRGDVAGIGDVAPSVRLMHRVRRAGLARAAA